MGDLADQAGDLIEREMTMRMATRRQVALPPRRSCYNCDEPLDADARFCDIDCRNDFEYRERRKKGQPG